MYEEHSLFVARDETTEDGFWLVVEINPICDVNWDFRIDGQVHHTSRSGNILDDDALIHHLWVKEWETLVAEDSDSGYTQELHEGNNHLGVEYRLSLLTSMVRALHKARELDTPFTD